MTTNKPIDVDVLILNLFAWADPIAGGARPVELRNACYLAATALRSLEAERDALKAERDKYLEDLGLVIMACPMSPEMRTSPAHIGVRALRADRDRLASRVERLEKALEPFARREVPDSYKTAFVMADDLRTARAARKETQDG